MRSIETSGTPLGYRVGNAREVALWPRAADGEVRMRTIAIALPGMQKEAVVWNGATGRAWRMVSDEGRGLSGTNLAPFPLAFFTGGLALVYLDELAARAAASGLSLDDAVLWVDSRYSIEGSALKGTMVSSADPAEITLASGNEKLSALLDAACDAVPVDRLFREVSTSLFTLTHNGSVIPTGRIAGFEGDVLGDGSAVIEALRPAQPQDFADGIIEKADEADQSPSGSAPPGGGFLADQRRTLHLRAVARRRADGLIAVDIQTLRPAVITGWRFVGALAREAAMLDRAPTGLDFVSAGIAFCYMTQLARYAKIAKLGLDRYSVVQDTRFSAPGAPPLAAPVETHIHVESPEPADAVRRMADMAESTCFLHAICRSELRTERAVGTEAARESV